MDYSLLSGSPLFKGINSGSLELILTEIPHRVRKYQSGLIVAQAGEQVTSLIIVLKGMVKGLMVDFAGRVIKIEDIPAPGTLAAAFIFGNINKFPVNVIAVSDSEILFIDKTDFLKILMKNDILLINFLNMISNRSQFLSEKIKFLNFKTIKGKLANFILQKLDENGSSANLGMTQNDLADFFGVTRPSIARAIGEMEKDRYIEAKGRNIRIIDKKGLSELITD
jgi:CRP-like cAMP-binding protein